MPIVSLPMEGCECSMCRRLRRIGETRIRPVYREGISIIDGIMESMHAREAPRLYDSVENHKRGPSVSRKNSESNKVLDDVEWELVRADIAEKKAELEKNGDMAKWRKFQAEIKRRRL